MNTRKIVQLLILFVIRNFCNKHFQVLGRHQWRCRGKVKEDVNESNYRHGDESIDGDTDLPINSGQRNQSNTEMIQCACGNKFKGLRGIKKHQRSCRVIRGLDKELFSELQNISDFENQPDMNHHMVRSGENPMFKTGVKLPKSDEQWNLANSYSKAELPAHEIENKSLDDIADQFNIKVYNYIADNYSLVDNASDLDNSLKEKYTDYNKHKLKKCLRLLKANEPENLNEIRFVS